MLNYLFLPLTWLDSLVAPLLPYGLRLAIWGIIGGTLSLLLYAKLSNQDKIKARKQHVKELQRKMFTETDIPFDAFLKLARANFAASFAYLGAAVLPATLAGIPVLFLAAWIHVDIAWLPPEIYTAHTRTAQPQALTVTPAETPAGHLRISDGATTIYTGPLRRHPTPTITKRRWHHLIIATPAGYLQPDALIPGVTTNAIKRPFITGLPPWLATWEVTFFLFVCIAAVIVKIRLKLD